VWSDWVTNLLRLKANKKPFHFEVKGPNKISYRYLYAVAAEDSSNFCETRKTTVFFALYPQ
jgi:hypothetical protein